MQKQPILLQVQGKNYPVKNVESRLRRIDSLINNSLIEGHLREPPIFQVSWEINLRIVEIT